MEEPNPNPHHCNSYHLRCFLKISNGKPQRVCSWCCTWTFNQPTNKPINQSIKPKTNQQIVNSEALRWFLEKISDCGLFGFGCIWMLQRSTTFSVDNLTSTQLYLYRPLSQLQLQWASQAHIRTIPPNPYRSGIGWVWSIPYRFRDGGCNLIFPFRQK